MKLADGTQVCEKASSAQDRPPTIPKTSSSPPTSVNPEQALGAYEVLYMRRDPDRGAIDSVLRDAGISYIPLKGDPQDKPVNVVTCTADVPVAPVRQLTKMLLDANVNIVAIRPSIHSDKASRRLTVEYYYGLDTKSLLTKDQVDKLEECPKFNSITQNSIDFANWGFSVKNECNKTDYMYVYIIYLDIFDNKQKMATIPFLMRNESRNVAGLDGKNIFPAGDKLYYYATGMDKSTGTSYEWKGPPSSNQFDIPGRGNVPFRYIAANNEEIILTCK